MNYSLNFTASILVCSACLLPYQSLQASEISFTPRASVSLTSYKFSQTPRPGALAPSGINGDDFPEVTFDVTFKILGLGGTFFKDGYYLDLSVQKSADEEDSFTLDDPAIPGGTFTETFTGDREDFAITFGKKILDNKGGLYIGYKSGKSEASGDQGQHLSFKEKGLFIGANYGWKVSNSGHFSINFAFADLEGDLTEDVTNALFTSLPTPLDINATSDAQGLSYGLSWSSRLTDKLSYSVSVDSKKYTFDNIKDSNPATITSKEFEEELKSAMISVYFQF